jgi:hypothetical protein
LDQEGKYDLKKAAWTSGRPKIDLFLDAMSFPAALKATRITSLFVLQYRNTADMQTLHVFHSADEAWW